MVGRIEFFSSVQSSVPVNPEDVDALLASTGNNANAVTTSGASNPVALNPQESQLLALQPTTEAKSLLDQFSDAAARARLERALALPAAEKPVRPGLAGWLMTLFLDYAIGGAANTVQHWLGWDPTSKLLKAVNESGIQGLMNGVAERVNEAGHGEYVQTLQSLGSDLTGLIQTNPTVAGTVIRALVSQWQQAGYIERDMPVDKLVQAVVNRTQELNPQAPQTPPAPSPQPPTPAPQAPQVNNSPPPTSAAPPAPQLTTDQILYARLGDFPEAVRPYYAAAIFQYAQQQGRANTNEDLLQFVKDITSDSKVWQQINADVRSVILRSRLGGIPENLRGYYKAAIDQYARTHGRGATAADLLTFVNDITNGSKVWAEIERGVRDLILDSAVPRDAPKGLQDLYAAAILDKAHTSGRAGNLSDLLSFVNAITPNSKVVADIENRVVKLILDSKLGGVPADKRELYAQAIMDKARSSGRADSILELFQFVSAITFDSQVWRAIEQNVASKLGGTTAQGQGNNVAPPPTTTPTPPAPGSTPNQTVQPPTPPVPQTSAPPSPQPSTTPKPKPPTTSQTPSGAPNAPTGTIWVDPNTRQVLPTWQPGAYGFPDQKALQAWLDAYPSSGSGNVGGKPPPPPGGSGPSYGPHNDDDPEFLKRLEAAVNKLQQVSPEAHRVYEEILRSGDPSKLEELIRLLAKIDEKAMDPRQMTAVLRGASGRAGIEFRSEGYIDAIQKLIQMREGPLRLMNQAKVDSVLRKYVNVSISDVEALIQQRIGYKELPWNAVDQFRRAALKNPYFYVIAGVVAGGAGFTAFNQFINAVIQRDKLTPAVQQAGQNNQPRTIFFNTNREFFARGGYEQWVQQNYARLASDPKAPGGSWFIDQALGGGKPSYVLKPEFFNDENWKGKPDNENLLLSLRTAATSYVSGMSTTAGFYLPPFVGSERYKAFLTSHPGTLDDKGNFTEKFWKDPNASAAYQRAITDHYYGAILQPIKIEVLWRVNLEGQAAKDVVAIEVPRAGSGGASDFANLYNTRTFNALNAAAQIRDNWRGIADGQIKLEVDNLTNARAQYQARLQSQQTTNSGVQANNSTSALEQQRQQVTQQGQQVRQQADQLAAQQRQLREAQSANIFNAYDASLTSWYRNHPKINPDNIVVRPDVQTAFNAATINGIEPIPMTQSTPAAQAEYMVSLLEKEFPSALKPAQELLQTRPGYRVVSREEWVRILTDFYTKLNPPSVTGPDLGAKPKETSEIQAAVQPDMGVRSRYPGVLVASANLEGLGLTPELLAQANTQKPGQPSSGQILPVPPTPIPSRSPASVTPPPPPPANGGESSPTIQPVRSPTGTSQPGVVPIAPPPPSTLPPSNPATALSTQGVQGKPIALPTERIFGAHDPQTNYVGGYLPVLRADYAREAEQQRLWGTKDDGLSAGRYNRLALSYAYALYSGKYDQQLAQQTEDGQTLRSVMQSEYRNLLSWLPKSTEFAPRMANVNGSVVPVYTVRGDEWKAAFQSQHPELRGLTGDQMTIYGQIAASPRSTPQMLAAYPRYVRDPRGAQFQVPEHTSTYGIGDWAGSDYMSAMNSSTYLLAQIDRTYVQQDTTLSRQQQLETITRDLQGGRSCWLWQDPAYRPLMLYIYDHLNVARTDAGMPSADLPVYGFRDNPVLSFVDANTKQFVPGYLIETLPKAYQFVMNPPVPSGDSPGALRERLNMDIQPLLREYDYVLSHAQLVGDKSLLPGLTAQRDQLQALANKLRAQLGEPAPQTQPNVAQPVVPSTPNTPSVTPTPQGAPTPKPVVPPSNIVPKPNTLPTQQVVPPQPSNVAPKPDTLPKQPPPPTTPTPPPSPRQTTPSAPATYTVRSGDTLWAIARKNNTNVATLMRLNPQIANPNRLSIGQVIKLPGLSLRVAPTPNSGSNPSPTPTPVEDSQGGGVRQANNVSDDYQPEKLALVPEDPNTKDDGRVTAPAESASA